MNNITVQKKPTSYECYNQTSALTTSIVMRLQYTASVFHSREAATGKARLSMVERQMHLMTNKQWLNCCCIAIRVELIVQ